MRKFKILIILLVITIFSVFSVGKVLALEKLEFFTTSPPVKLPKTDLSTTIARIGNVLFFATVAIAFIMVVWGGVTLATAGGDPGKVELARRVIMYALIAIAVGAISYGLVNLIATYVGEVTTQKK